MRDPRVRRVRTVAAWAGFVLAVLAILVWCQAPALDVRPASAWTAIAVGVFFALTAAVVDGQRGQRGNAVVFVLLTLAWTCGRLAERGVGTTTVLFYLAASQVDVLAAAALLRYPSRALQSVDRLFVQVASVGALVLQAAVALTSTREELGVVPAPWPSPWGGTGWSAVAQAVRGAWFGGLALVFVVLLVRRWRRLVPLERRIVLPVVLTGLVVALATVPLLDEARLGATGLDVVHTVRSYAAVAVALAFVVSAVQLRLARSAVVALAARLAADPGVAAVEAALREALGDPGLEVWYHVGDAVDGHVVDGAGRDRRVPREGRLQVAATTAAGEPLATVVVDPGLDRHRELVDAAVAVSRFALENARLEASLRAQVLALDEARARLLSAGLEERRRLERDLHDGAQQRLLAVAMQLARVEVEAVPGTAAAVARARGELQMALEELRDLARGIHPAVLTQAGLGAALEGVVERMGVPVRARVAGRRWPPDVESAAYLVVCEALTNVTRHAGPCSVEVVVEDRGCELHVRVADDGVGGDGGEGGFEPVSLRDRVTAMGGRLRVRSAAGEGTTVEAWIPCA